MTRSSILKKTSIVQLTIDMLASELAETRGRSPLELGADKWDVTTRLDDEGLELDSLERLNATSALNSYFHLHEYGAEDYLLAMPTIGDWVDLIRQSLMETGERLTFRTSGSTGSPKECEHRVDNLLAETEHWAQMLSATKRIVSLVPSQHIYGTIWTILLPEILDVQCRYRRLTPSKAIKEAAGTEPTLIIATPTMWQFLAKSLPRFSSNLLGITSTGPMPTGLSDTLHEKGLARLIEVYGSSETGAIGWRDHDESDYRLLDMWSRLNEGELLRSGHRGSDGKRILMDKLSWADDRHFSVEGRLDGAVQIGGHNVFPDRIRATLVRRPEIADAAVRLDEQSGRLKAFLVPENSDAIGEDLIREIDGWCADALPAHERPRNIVVGDALPRNAIGKLSDW